ncbi:MAG: glycosyltransferase [Verrucomicrobia bacterium]|nr:glycosyltransferase [Cytophagales bacterium]
MERLIKSILIFDFFLNNRTQIPSPGSSISLIQPITSGATNLVSNLQSRLVQLYTGTVEHLWICDESDGFSQEICEQLQQKYSQKNIKILLAKPENGSNLAGKIQKMNVGCWEATGAILVFIDDDIALPSQGLRQLISPLQDPEIGAVFGLACGVSYENFWSGMMSSFVNVNALMNYVPLTYFLAPYTITGHFFAVRQADFEKVGGFWDMGHRIDDDHELARRLNKAGLTLKQSAVCYQVNNQMADFRAFHRQMKRWFVFPKKFMTPFLSARQQLVSGLVGSGILLPSLILLCNIFFPSFNHLYCLAYTALAALAGYNVCFAQNPFRKFVSWLFVLPVVFLLPFYVVWGLFFADNKVYWRGQKLAINADGTYAVV